MLKKLTTKGINKQTKEFEERTANLPCSAECLKQCILAGGGRFSIYNSGLEYIELPIVFNFPQV